MKLNNLMTPFLLLVLSTIIVTSVFASSRKYKNTHVHSDDNAWYVGSWHGTNLAFVPPLEVEITILPSGEIFTCAHGEDRSYKVHTHGKVIKVKKLPDTPMRGKMKDAYSMILEDGGLLEISQEQSGLQTTAAKLGIVVHYQKVSDPEQMMGIQNRLIAQAATEAHHKDNDFWHSPEFWSGVVVGAVVNASVHDDHITLKSSGISKADVAALQKYYK